MLSDEDKKIFEERAKKISEEMQAKQQEADKAFNESLTRSQSPWEGTAGRMSPGLTSQSFPKFRQIGLNGLLSKTYYIRLVKFLVLFD